MVFFGLKSKFNEWKIIDLAFSVIYEIQKRFQEFSELPDFAKVNDMKFFPLPTDYIYKNMI